MFEQEENSRKSKAKTTEQALETLRWLCSKMERCRSDIRRSLYRWQVPKDEWDTIVETLEKERFVDEQRYADAYVRSKRSAAGWGEGKIRHNLRTKGIDKEVVDRAIAENLSSDQMSEKLEQLIRTRYKRYAPKTEQEFKLKGKIAQAALAAGFGYDEIMDKLEKFWKNEKDNN